MSGYQGSERPPLHYSYSHSHPPGQDGAQRLPFSIKTEIPDTPPTLTSPAEDYPFSFRSHSQLPRLSHLPASTSASSSPSLHRPLSSSRPWPHLAISSQGHPSVGHMLSPNPAMTSNLPASLNLNSFHHSAMSFHDESYDDADEYANLSSGGNASPTFGDSARSSSAMQKAIRRRSSKACDQCRKSKCKCERNGEQEACKNCVMLGTSCTFFGPSRKRGPPKGYIDAIEARLHQMEALIGIILASGDSRADALLQDLKQDDLASAIIEHVDRSSYGPAGRNTKQRVEGEGSGKGSGAKDPKSVPSPQYHSKTKANLESLSAYATTHPSTEWQDKVLGMLNTKHPPGASDSLLALRYADQPPRDLGASMAVSSREQLRITPLAQPVFSSVENGDSSRRQRRRLDDPPLSALSEHPPLSAVSEHASSSGAGWRGMTSGDSEPSEEEPELPDAMGQLSLNEDEQVRFHSKISGLHLLGQKERIDGRNEGGIWRFPPARIWPPLPPTSKSDHPRTLPTESEYGSSAALPDLAQQNRFLQLYWDHVHPIFPLIDKHAFVDAWKTRAADERASVSPSSSTSENGTSKSLVRRRYRIPILLLLSMFAVSARHEEDRNNPPPAANMWAAGDIYLEAARAILDHAFSVSRPSTCQALLLMGYREIGIGAMAQAWIYIGMAIRMAQDLGMHRSADGWARASMGGPLFSDAELQERKRIWFTCVVMDRYVSSYIGRPLAIFDHDFDTALPSLEDSEEMEIWKPLTAPHQPAEPWGDEDPQNRPPPTPLPSRVISCFNASARLSLLLGDIMRTIYPTRPMMKRSLGRQELVEALQKWYIELPKHLCLDLKPTSKDKVALPNVLNLHMQYWCTVILVHRPFIGKVKPKDAGLQESEEHALARASYETCAAAANKITAIVSLYNVHYCMRRAPVFFCYYLFTACIMHVTTLTFYPSDPQALTNLPKCIDALSHLDVVWPSAGRALELLRGARDYPAADDRLDALFAYPPPAPRHKRPAENQSIEGNDTLHRGSMASPSSYWPIRSNPAPSSEYDQGRAEYSGSSAVPGMVNSSYPFYNSNSRWYPPPQPPSSNPYGGSLSTSVLPQLYSTGLGTDRPTPSSHFHDPSSVETHAHEHSPSRYPQYWNDVSAFPQIGSAYAIPSNALHPQASPTQDDPQLYLHDQFNLYNNPGNAPR